MDLVQDHLLTERDLSVYLGLSIPTLQRMRAAGTGPLFVQLSERRIAYRRSNVDAWLAARTKDRIGQQQTGTPLATVVERYGGAGPLGQLL